MTRVEPTFRVRAGKQLNDADLVSRRRGLPRFVNALPRPRPAITTVHSGALEESLLPFFQGDGVHDALALQALETGSITSQIGGVLHDRDLATSGSLASCSKYVSWRERRRSSPRPCRYR
jgi:hypothetical protein